MMDEERFLIRLHNYVLEKVMNGEISFLLHYVGDPKEFMDTVDKASGYGLYYSEEKGLSYGGVALNYPLADAIVKMARKKAMEKITIENRREHLRKLNEIAVRLGWEE